MRKGFVLMLETTQNMPRVVYYAATWGAKNPLNFFSVALQFLCENIRSLVKKQILKTL